ncbi:MAG: DUF4870 domain-containing protein [Actinomycetota bacterium]|nr:DUF4870 domain-containing protein [Actinomycetota bacterium]
MAEVNMADIDADFSKKSSTGMEPKIAVLLAYLFGWLGGLIIMILEKENKFVKWNALQALILGILEVLCVIVISFLLGLIPFIGKFLFSRLGYVATVVLWIFGIVAIVQGFQGKSYRIPMGISTMTDKYFKM